MNYLYENMLLFYFYLYIMYSENKAKHFTSNFPDITILFSKQLKKS